MSSSTFAGNSASGEPGFCPAPPPPPPPPVPGQVPALRINTVEAPVPRRPLPNNNNPYEPPAAIQNAMMTKDKKPFTYTPGMGGKLDLSQIRSPRMARRVAKNANDEGIEGPPKSSLAAEPRPVSTGPNLYIQPQVAVPVFPTNVPPQPSANRAPSAPASRVPSNASDRVVEVQRPVTRVEMKPTTQVVSPQPTPPETPTTPPQVTLAKAPTPWLQNKNKPQEELPEWAKRASVNRPSSSTSPESPNSHTAQIQINQTQPQVQQTIQLQQPPLSRQHQPPPPPRQQSLAQERVIPLRIEDRPSVFSVKHEPGHHQFKQQPQQPSPHHQQRWGNSTSPQTPVQAQSPQYPNQSQQQQYPQPSRPQPSGGGTYIVPIMVEGANSNNGPSATVYNQPQQVQTRSQPIQNQSPRVIVQRGPPSPQIQQQGEPGPLQSRSFRVLQKITDTDVPDEVDGEQMRKLQLTEDDKILMNKFKEQGRQWVDLCTDETNRDWHQPADRDASFDHTFVVDGDGTYLHQEEDPRYRGAAIPSRAFRFLQNMTDSGDVTTTANAPRAPSAINKRQNRNSRTFEESQANLPASEQQAPEPKKYTGSAIPSRSFRILQAMTSPESIAKQENRQAVVTCRTESSMQPVNQQQSVFLSSPSFYDSSSEPLATSQSQQSQPPQLQPLPPPFWQYPEGSCWWGYYPFHYSAIANVPPTLSSSPLELSSATPNNTHNSPSYESCAYCTGYHHHHHLLHNGNAFAYFRPLYDQHLYAPAALSSPNRLSSISSSVSSNSATVAAAAAVRQCTNMSSSSNGETLAVVTLNEFPSDDTGVSSTPNSSSFSSSTSSSVSSRLAAARSPSTIEHPASAACFVPAFIHHQPPKDSPGYDSNCNPCLERTAAGATTIFRCPPPMCVLNSVNPGEGISGSGGTSVWTCQDPTLTEPGPPPWSQYYQNAPYSDMQRNENVRSQEKSVPEWNLDGSIGQRKDKLITKEDDGEGSGGCNTLISKKKDDRPIPEWSRNHLEDKEDDVGRLGRNSHEILTNQDDETGNSTWKTLNSEANADDLKFTRAKSRYTRKNIEAKENDVERSGRTAVINSVNQLEATHSKWSGNNAGAENVDTDQLGRGTDRNPIDQEGKIEDPRWNRIDNASRNLNELDASIPMNILHEDRNANDSSVFNTVNINEGTASLGEDHYSEDGNGTESDSESDSTSSESSGDADPVCSEPPTNTDVESDSESDSDDSDSYLAYSTGLNPHNVFMTESNSSANVNHAEKEFRKSQTATTIDEDAFDERSFALSSDRMNSTDCDSCVEDDDVVEEETKINEEEKAKCEHLKAEDIVPHRLSVIHEDSEQGKIGSDGWQDIPTDDSATVSVSLPLKFRFSVSENDQNVTTVIVGDTTVKTKETCQTEESETEDVCINLKIDEDTTPSVDFTLRKTVSQETNEDDFDFWATQAMTSNCKTPEEIPTSRETEIKEGNATEMSKEIGEVDANGTNYEDDSIDFWETLKSGNESLDFNFNSGRARNGLEKSSLPKIRSEEENPEPVVTKENDLGEEKMLTINEVLNDFGKDSEKEEDDDNDGQKEIEKEEEAEEEEDTEEEDEDEEEEDPEEATIQKSDENKEEVSLSINAAPLFELTEAKMEDNDNEEEPTSGRSNVETAKHLLSIQNSRDETDDEDSGVTSDMSRLISEVDTDSECGPTRKINSYKRTQTHSRLFRLLSREDDAQANEEIKSSAARRDRLSLPLKTSGFSYDESHHCSNYSSGLTSPDYSPVYEGSWRRLHEENAAHPGTPENLRSPAGLINDEEYCKNRKDPYFETWKKTVAEDMIQEEKKISSSAAVKMLSNGGSNGGYGLASWRFRTNVICPRIKSTKNVPRVMRQNRPANTVVACPSTSESGVATSEKC